MFKNFCKRIIFILIFYNSFVYSDTYFDGRFYEQALLFFDKKVSYSGFTILGLNLDTRPFESVRIRSEIELPFNHNRKVEDPKLKVNTLNISFLFKDSRLTVGRFLPLWGVCRVFRPMDLFRTQTFIQHNLSFSGVDGFFWKFYSDSISSGFIVLPESDIENTRLSVFLEKTYEKFEGFVAYLYDPYVPESFVGGTFRMDLFFTLKAETLYKYSYKTFNNDRSCFKFSVSADWSCKKIFFISAGYFFDESGVLKESYKLLRSFEPDRFTLSRHYIDLDSFLIFDDLRTGISGIMNLIDKSIVCGPYFSFELFDNLFIGFSWYLFFGKKDTEFNPLYKYGICDIYSFVKF